MRDEIYELTLALRLVSSSRVARMLTLTFTRQTRLTMTVKGMPKMCSQRIANDIEDNLADVDDFMDEYDDACDDFD